MSRPIRILTVALNLALLSSSSAALARPAIQPSAAPSSQRPKPIHGKPAPPQPKPIEPWTQAPKYGAPWKKQPTQADKRSPPVGGSAFEFFFWIYTLLGLVTCGAWVRARRKAVDWELRSDGALATGGPSEDYDEGDSTDEADRERPRRSGET